MGEVQANNGGEERRRVQIADDHVNGASSGGKSNGTVGSLLRSSVLRAAIAKGVVDVEEASNGSDVSWLLTHLNDIIATRHLTTPFRRKTPHRIFVNRALQLDKIRFFGFDMDYTLAEYISPEYECLQFDLSIERLIDHMGYPAAIRSNYHYDPSFSIRGLWFDRLYGNLLKVDQFGSILVAFHGLKALRTSKILELYPNKFVLNDPNRIYILNTLFDYSTVYLLACVVDYFNCCGNGFEIESTGVKNGDLFISYKSIYIDVRTSVDFVHHSGLLQQRTLEDISKYLSKDQRLPMMLQRLRQHAKVFILTNSGYHYTNAVMKYLLEEPDKPDIKWTSFFDAIVVDAGKPVFFEEGTLLRQVDSATGALAIGRHTGPLRTGHVYSGGSCDTFSDLMGAKGRDVLYVGDHIFGDILKSKKRRGWRTYLVVPELHQELLVWTSKRDMFQQLQQLDILLADVYKFLDSSSTSLETPQSSEIALIKKASRHVSREMELAYGGPNGSIFRAGGRQTFFANQVQRYADIYAVSSLNLLHYPYSYFFKAPPVLLPHEATVDHNSGYNPLAAVGEVPTSQLELVQASPKVKLFGRMSMKALSMATGESFDNDADNPLNSANGNINNNQKEDDDEEEESDDESPSSPESTTPEITPTKD